MAITSAPKTLCIRLVGNPDTDLRCIVYCFSILCILSPERLIKKVGRDVMDRDFAYIYSLIFNYPWGLFIVCRALGPQAVSVQFRLLRGTAVSEGSPFFNHW